MERNIFIELLPHWVETDLQPAFYDRESGTVLQQISRLWAKVIEIIKGFNTFTDDVTTVTNNYIKAFNELHDYVEDYFDNLDVQEEINNKLDQMAEDGTLADIVSQYLNSTAIFGYDTVADMKSAENLINGSYAKTLGYYEKNDGGSALYKIRSVTNEDEEDDMFIIRMNDTNLIAELITEKPVNICKVGGQHNTAYVINALINKGLDVYIPEQDFTIEDTIDLSVGNTTLVCDGNLSSTSVMTYFKVGSSSNKVELNGKIEGWKLNNINAPTLMEIGSASKYVEYNTVYVKEANKFAIGFKTQPNNQKGVSYLNATFSHIEALTGILMSCGDTGRNYVNENTFNGGRLESDYGIVFEKGSQQVDPYNGNVFNNVAVEKGQIIRCIDLNFATYNHFNDMRISEGLDNSEHPIKIASDCRCNVITTKYQLRPSQILDETSGDTYRNYFKAGLAKNDYTKVGDNFYTYKGNEIIKLEDSYNIVSPVFQNTNDTNANTTEQLTNSDGFFIDKGMTLKVTVSYGGIKKILKLPKGMDKNSIQSFNVVFVYKENNSKVEIQDFDGNILIGEDRFPLTKLERKMYEVRFTNNANTSRVNNWSIIELQ